MHADYCGNDDKTKDWKKIEKKRKILVTDVQKTDVMSVAVDESTDKTDTPQLTFP